MRKAKKTAMDIVAEVHEQDKKIFFYAKGPLDPRAWAEMWDREKAAKYVESYLKEAGVADKPFQSFRIEKSDDEGEVRVMIWGVSSPGVDLNDYGDQVGLAVELDEEEVFNSLKEIEEGESEED
jgi:hypothetical protein